MNDMDILNIALDTASIFICFFGIVVAIVSRRFDRRLTHIFGILFLSHLLMVSSNLFGILYRHNTTQTGLTIIPIANFCEFFFNNITAFFIIQYVLSFLGKNQHNKLLSGIGTGIFTIYTVLIVVNIFHPFLYYQDSFNVYHRGDYYWIVTAVGSAYAVLSYYIGIRSYASYRIEEKIIFLIYAVVSFFTIILQYLIYGIYIILCGITLYLTVVFVLSLQLAFQDYARDRDELAQIQTRIMLSQIQPHFLFNCLGTIEVLCSDAPDKAAQAVDQFARYLRVNLDSLKQKTPIPLEKELQHVDNYLSLEKIRFGDDIQVTYDIQTTDCFIPQLTIQSIVENAILHGMMGKEGAIHISISCHKTTDEQIEIVITDDGSGFDVMTQKEKSERSHVGLDNIRSRLEAIVDGKLKVESVQGIGTRVTILLPENNWKFGGGGEDSC